MTAKTYELSPLAEVDLEGIWLYTFEHWSSEQADRYYWNLVAAFGSLASGYVQGRKVDVQPGYLKYLCSAHMVYFRGRGDRLDIIRVLHQRQDGSRNL